jgi:ribosome biogenesis GTPase
MPIGTVVEYHREYCWIHPDEGGTELIARPRGRMELIWKPPANPQPGYQQLAHKFAPGDRVVYVEPETKHYLIEEVLERETWLIRKSLGKFNRKPQVVVANADCLVVVMAPNPVIRLSTVDRYFLAAIQGGLQPILVVNKIDLDPGLPDRADIRVYRERGYKVFFTQATDGTGLEALKAEITGKFSAFCGHSGVGKSTILTQLTGQHIAVGEVKKKSLKGRQTTVTARVYALPGGGMVLDTPGVREFGLTRQTWTEVHEYFSDIAELSMQCRYRDCMHDGGSKSGCAIQQAIDEERLAAERLKSYQKLRREAEAELNQYN